MTNIDNLHSDLDDVLAISAHMDDLCNKAQEIICTFKTDNRSQGGVMPLTSIRPTPVPHQESLVNSYFRLRNASRSLVELITRNVLSITANNDEIQALDYINQLH
jgi:hypothetical protein